MDAILTTFVSVLIAEIGDRTQILAAALALRYHRNGPVLAGLALATFINCLLSAMGGSFIDSWISERPVRLFAGLAYLFAGAAMLMWRRAVDPLKEWKMPAFVTAFLGLFILELGDKSQFIIAAQAARYEHWFMVPVGGFIGIMAATVPAVLLREKLAQVVPVKIIRWIGGGILLLWGIVLALQALGLV